VIDQSTTAPAGVPGSNVVDGEFVPRPSTPIPNGTGSSSATSQPVQAAEGPNLGMLVPDRIEWVKMPGTYGQAGWEVRMWVNFRRKYSDQLGSNDTETIRKALGKIIQRHNGWVYEHEIQEQARDEHGELMFEEDQTPIMVDTGRTEVREYPPTSSPEFWELIPDELLSSIIVVIHQKTQELPNSLMTRRRN
jgi:hypothetical protein